MDLIEKLIKELKSEPNPDYAPESILLLNFTDDELREMGIDPNKIEA